MHLQSIILLQETKEVNEEVALLEREQKQFLETLDAEQIKLRQLEDCIPDIDKQIRELQLVKNHVRTEQLIKLNV